MGTDDAKLFVAYAPGLLARLVNRLEDGGFPGSSASASHEVVRVHVRDEEDSIYAYIPVSHHDSDDDCFWEDRWQSQPGSERDSRPLHFRVRPTGCTRANGGYLMALYPDLGLLVFDHGLQCCCSFGRSNELEAERFGQFFIDAGAPRFCIAPEWCCASSFGVPFDDGSATTLHDVLLRELPPGLMTPEERALATALGRDDDLQPHHRSIAPALEASLAAGETAAFVAGVAEQRSSLADDAVRVGNLLRAAAALGRTRMVRALLDAGLADALQAGIRAELLHVAIRAGSPSTAKVLLDCFPEEATRECAYHAARLEQREAFDEVWSTATRRRE